MTHRPMTAFEITIDDVSAVLDGMGRPCSDDDARRILGLLDLTAVEGAALHGDEMEEQTGYAYEEIERQVGSLEPPPPGMGR